MAFSLRDLANFQLSAYADDPRDSFSRWVPETPTNPVAYGAIYEPDETLIVLPGSKTPLDWLLDFFAIPCYSLNTYGRFSLHSGFLVGLGPVIAALEEAMLSHGPKLVTICGHSLGAARAAAAVLLSADKTANLPLRFVGWGCPRIGDSLAWEHLAALCYSSDLYINGFDPVPRLPFALPHFPYASSPIAIDGKLRTTLLHIPPATTESLKIVAWHNMELYQEGMPR